MRRIIITCLLLCLFTLSVYSEDNNKNSSIQNAECSLDNVNKSNVDDLMQYSSGSTYSSQTPMGTHYENRHITTDFDRIWLRTADNEPSIPSGLSNLHMEHFNVNLYPYGTPDPADINQHSIGDCDAIAVMASMAYVHPGFVKSIIFKNNNGTFNVKMFDPQGKAVTVVVSSAFLTDSKGNIAATSGKNNVATWATVLEKAIMKYEMIYQVNTDIGGMGSEHVTPLFTGNGNSFAFSPGKLTGDQLAFVVKYSLKHGRFITGGFNKVVTIGKYSTVPGHGYTLMFSSTSQSLFAMRNPWGFNPGGNGGDDGVLNIPLSGDVINTIDIRIIYPGKAGNKCVIKPYISPSFTVNANNQRVDPSIINNSSTNKYY